MEGAQEEDAVSVHCSKEFPLPFAFLRGVHWAGEFQVPAECLSVEPSWGGIPAKRTLRRQALNHRCCEARAGLGQVLPLCTRCPIAIVPIAKVPL